MSHAEGEMTHAKGDASHTEGGSTVASDYGCHAEGYSTVASGYTSHAEGQVTLAKGLASHAEGERTTAENESEHAEGRNNVSHKASETYGNSGNTQHSVGIGTSPSDKKNAFEIMQNGDAYLFGVGGYDGTNATASTSNTLQQCIGKMQEITWSALKSLRDSSGLTPGMQYRITDYNTTTVQADTQSAGHQFDIIVIADDNHTLNENARAVRHSGDTYFSGSTLEAWEIKYDLDNDTTKYAWADSGATGRGVIYYMKDERDNECPYDFKNIQFCKFPSFEAKMYGVTHTYSKNGEVININNVDYYGYTRTRTGMGPPPPTTPLYVTDIAVTTGSALYTIANNTATLYTSATIDSADNSEWVHYTFTFSNTHNGVPLPDTDISSNYPKCKVWSNVIKPYYLINTQAPDKKQYLNNITLRITSPQVYQITDNFFGNDCSGITINANVYKNIFIGQCYQLSFANVTYNNVFYQGCRKNTFLNQCYNNIFNFDCSGNTFSGTCYRNTFGNMCCSNTFGNNCYYNTLGNKCYSNTFGNSCFSNTFGDNCYSNVFEGDCHNNTFENYCSTNTFNGCSNNTFGNYCYSNTFGGGCIDNTFGSHCNNNTFGNQCNYNTFGNSCYYNTFGEACGSNTFGNSCYYNTFGDNCNSNTFGGNCHYNTLGNNCSSNTFREYVQYFITGNATGATTSAQTKDYIQYLIVENGVQNVNAYCTGTTSSSDYCQNIKIGLGIKGTSSSDRLQIDITQQIGATASVTYQPANSQVINI